MLPHNCLWSQAWSTCTELLSSKLSPRPFRKKVVCVLIDQLHLERPSICPLQVLCASLWVPSGIRDEEWVPNDQGEVLSKAEALKNVCWSLQAACQQRQHKKNHRSHPKPVPALLGSVHSLPAGLPWTPLLPSGRNVQLSSGHKLNCPVVFNSFSCKVKSTKKQPNIHLLIF